TSSRLRLCPVRMPFIFFFQAEDGIRDFHVTGVQTCALPILCLRAARKALKPAEPAPTIATSTRRVSSAIRSPLSRIRAGQKNQWNQPHDDRSVHESRYFVVPDHDISCRSRPFGAPPERLERARAP